MEAKHTPGPWFIADETRAVWSVMARGSNVSGVVAHVNTDWPGPAQKEEQRANARLIAAAPELLVSAHDFLEVLSERGLLCECGEAECRTTRVRAAVAKATGAA